MVDCRVPGAPADVAQSDRAVASALNTAFIASNEEDSRPSRVDENEILKMR